MVITKNSMLDNRNWAPIKYFILIFFSSALFVGLIFLVLLNEDIKGERERRELDEEGHVKLETEEIVHDVIMVISDLKILSKQSELLQYINKDRDLDITELQDELLTLSQQKGVYDQVRILDEKGMEVIKVSYNKGRSVLASKSELHNRAESNYFKEVSKLISNREMYIAPYDLDSKDININVPLKVTMRFCAPLFDEHDEFQGAAIIDFMTGNMIKKVVNHAAHPYQQVLLLNDKGLLLYALKETGMKDRSFAAAYPDIWGETADRDNGQVYTKDGLYSFAKVYPVLETELGWLAQWDRIELMEKCWTVISHVPETVLQSNRYQIIYKILKVYAGLMILLIIGSYLAAKELLNRKRAAEEKNVAMCDLKERIKELNGLHSLEELTYEAENMEDLFNTFLKDIIPESMQFPDKTLAGIDLDGKEYYCCTDSDDYKALLACNLSALIKVGGRKRGELIVGYTEELPFIDKYEQRLINTYAERLSRFIEQRETREGMKVNYNNQLTLGSLLQISLKEITLEEQLNLSLYTLSSMPWLNAKAAGAIFLFDEESDSLVLKVQRGLSKEIQEKCKHVKVGECLCGKAAETGEVIFSDKMTEGHTVSYEGITSHGHYCTPIISMGKVIGVINLYLNEGHKYDDSEVTFLEAAANSLSGLIERKRVEKEKESLWKQFLQAQKMETIGRLTGGIAHDFNNILTGIIGYSELALRSLEKDDPLYKKLNAILGGGEKAAKLVKQLLAFSRKQLLEVRLNNLNIIIDDMMKMLTRVIGEDIKLNINISKDIRNVKVDDTQIEQVLMNLVVNARDAMPDGGQITIKTEDVDLDEEYCKTHQGMPVGPYVMLSVEDTGSGMTKEVQEKIFEPFFTTKEVGKGTGLGMATVFGIVKQHNGTIWLYSEPGKGTIFKIYFPVAETGAVKKHKRYLDTELKRGVETILIVDDDAVVLSVVKEMLKELGYKILEAHNGEEALSLINDSSVGIDLLLTDVVMTGMNGWELYCKSKEKYPDTKVIFTSGYLDNPVVLKNIMEEGLPFINKPFRPFILSNNIREVLDEKEEYSKSA